MTGSRDRFEKSIEKSTKDSAHLEGRDVPSDFTRSKKVEKFLVERKTYSVPEVAKILGISRNSVYAAVARGDIKSVKIGGRLIIPKRVIDKLLSGE